MNVCSLRVLFFLGASVLLRGTREEVGVLQDAPVDVSINVKAGVLPNMPGVVTAGPCPQLAQPPVRKGRKMFICRQMTVNTVVGLHQVVKPEDSVIVNLVGINSWLSQVDVKDEEKRQFSSYWRLKGTSPVLADLVDQWASDLGIADGEKKDQSVGTVIDANTRAFSVEHAVELDLFLKMPKVVETGARRGVALDVPSPGLPWSFDDFGRWEIYEDIDSNADMIRHIILELKKSTPFGEVPSNICDNSDGAQDAFENWWKWYSEPAVAGASFDMETMSWSDVARGISQETIGVTKYKVNGPTQSGLAGFEEWKQAVQDKITEKAPGAPDWTKHTMKEEALMIFGFTRECSEQVGKAAEALKNKGPEGRKLFRGLEVLVKAIFAYKPTGSLSDAATLLVALYGNLTVNTQSWKMDWIPYLRRAKAEECPEWYPDFFLFDGELDDLIAWAMLEYLAVVCDWVPPRVALQVPSHLPIKGTKERVERWATTHNIKKMESEDAFVKFFDENIAKAYYEWDDGARNGKNAYRFWPGDEAGIDS